MRGQVPQSKKACAFILVVVVIATSLPLLLGYTRIQYHDTALEQGSGAVIQQKAWLPRHGSLTVKKANVTVDIEQTVKANVNITIYIEQLAAMDYYYGFRHTKIWQKIPPDDCLKAEGGTCRFQDKSPNVDVVFRQAQMYHQHKPMFPYRYCDNQIVAALNTETEEEYFMESMRNADIRIGYRLHSEVIDADACGIPWNEDLYKTPNVTGRKGVALLMSNCGSKWRNDYIQEVMKYIHVYSYGKCYHNVQEPSSRHNHGISFPRIASKHRMVITFENHITPDYISEKIALCYTSGVVPVYWGPPEIYQWVPGEHSFIDPQKFKGPKELAEYLKRVDEDDELFTYHTTNFNYTLAKQTHAKACDGVSMPCQICEIAHDIKVKRIKDGISTNCTLD